MLFNSITIANFFAIVYCIYWSISKRRRPVFLILSSCFFSTYLVFLGFLFSLSFCNFTQLFLLYSY
ncbi:hypothetical protein AMR47_11660 [Leptospira interrogans]|nr:hypothetical protein AMR47_11660 [Leptospira interrogans]